MDSKASAILGYWRDIEYLNPQSLNKEDATKLRWMVSRPAELPWINNARRTAAEKQISKYTKRKMEISYFVYCGIYDLGAIAKQLTGWYGQETEQDRQLLQQKSGRAAAVLVKTDSKGVVRDISISSTPWYMGRLAPASKANPMAAFEGQNGFEHFVKEKLLDHVSDSVAIADSQRLPERVLLKLQHEDTSVLSEIFFGYAGWRPEHVSPACLVEAKITEVGAETSTDDLLNSFIAADLENVQKEIRQGNFGQALNSYLGSPSEMNAKRLDIMRDNGREIFKTSAPRLTPKGRWPTANPLAVAQQFAINKLMSEIGKDGGIFSINGPPGTGKTTLLKDLVASVVTDRAEVLARFESASEAFGAEIKLPESEYPGRALNGVLHDFGIVVTSSNNAAIENISLELPTKKSLEGVDFQVDYFSQISDRLIAREPSDEMDADQDDDSLPASHGDVATWGLISAALGKAENKTRFVNRFWWGGKQPDGTPEPCFKDCLWGKVPGALNWDEARRLFLGRLDTVNQQREVLEKIHADIRGSIADRSSLAELEFKQDTLAKVLKKISAKREGIKREIADLKIEKVALDARARANALYEGYSEQRDRSKSRLGDFLRKIGGINGRSDLASELKQLRGSCERTLRKLELTKPSWLVRLFRPTEFAKWENDYERTTSRIVLIESAFETWQEYMTARRGLENLEEGGPLDLKAAAKTKIELRFVTDRLSELDSVANDLSDTAARTEASLSSVSNQMASLKRAIGDARRRQTENCLQVGLSDAVIDVWTDFNNREKFQQAAHWYTKEYYRSRFKLFEAALELHKAFFKANHLTLINNLGMMCEVLQGKAEADPKLMPHLWSTLFLVVPVVSTTFASFPRLFNGMGRESIGWLLVDEAGQATPQAAVGAIWRSKRAVIVGDPLQLEPIVSLPEKAVDVLRERIGVSSEWHPTRCSAQVVADRANMFGTYIATGGIPTWVGAPLIVHRRCQNPMFAISNDIAYGDTMVHGRETAVKGISPDSRWIDLKPEGERGHWVPNQADEAVRIVQGIANSVELRTKTGEYNVFVITPYRDVAEGCRAKLKAIGIDSPEKICGTIHTFQGREAKTVILLLGGDPKKESAVTAFAAKSPNLLNVAVTRAKDTLIVIGDTALWASAPYFKTMARKLKIEKK